ncbi:hypothetical protein E8K88_16330 [Lampropedia aestuarii]|uniref:Uncharacterized protein n=1 Tax=Lampropedia aestuarii TaxID=2562762 RepID=A0A4S5BJ51_9BURK|nr:hypothetical protein [Lampropedia aestuarii]THJ30933.1 hypothetical protein E8K88_16330 [Lampropedia aestuarii]
MTDIVDVPDIPVLPTPPSTNDPQNFSPRADGFLGILPEWSDGLDGVAESAKTNATAANERAVAAAASAATASTKANEAAASAELAKNAPTTYGTTAQALNIGAGAKSLTVETGRAFMSGQAVVLAAAANPINQRMYGIVTAYNAATGALSVTVSAFTGSGSVIGWTVTLGNAPAQGGLAVLNVAANANAAAGVYHVITAAGVTLTMPAAPEVGDEIGFCNASSGEATVNWSGKTVKGTAPSPQAMIVPRYGAAVVKFNGSTWA